MTYLTSFLRSKLPDINSTILQDTCLANRELGLKITVLSQEVLSKVRRIDIEYFLTLLRHRPAYFSVK